MKKSKKITILLTSILLICLSVLTLTGSTSASNMEEKSQNSAINSTSAPVETIRTSTITLYDGSVDTAMISSTEKNELTLTTKGFSNSPKKLVDVTCNDKAYSYSTPTGGKSSASRSLELTVPETYKAFKVYMVATTNNSTPANIGIGLTAEYNTTDNLILTTTADIDTYSFGYSESMTSGTYFITFDNSVRIAEISVAVDTIESVGTETNSAVDSSSDEDLLIGNKVTPMTRAKKIRIVVATLLVVLLVVLIVILIINTSKKRKNCVSKEDLDYLLNLYDDYFDED